MENDTFRSRLVRLLQKSRQAFRLYNSMERGPAAIGDYTEMQAMEWRNVNGALIKELSAALDRPNQKETPSLVFLLRDRFLAEFRTSEADLHAKQRELVSAAEKGDFVKSALLSKELVSIKARVQATQAAHHELDEVVVQSKVSQPAITLSNESVVAEPRQERLARVIPLRSSSRG